MKNKDRLIFVTNDDGYQAKGFEAALEVAREFGRVLAVAPATAQSGKSQAITMYDPLFLDKRRPASVVTSSKDLPEKAKGSCSRESIRIFIRLPPSASSQHQSKSRAPRSVAGWPRTVGASRPAPSCR